MLEMTPSRRWAVCGRSCGLLGQRDDGACGTAEVAEPVAVLVLHQLADEFSSVWPQAVEDVVDVLDGEHDAMCVQRVRWGARVSVWARGRLVLVSSSRPWPFWGSPHCNVRSDSVKPDEAVHPAALDCGLAFQVQSKFGEERHGCCEVVDDDGDVVHPLDRPAPMTSLVGVAHGDLPSGGPSGSTAGVRVQVSWRSCCCCMSSSMAVGRVVSKSISLAQVGFTTTRTMPV